jgi:ribosomal-protein-alanine N-acetyltransferase
MVSLRLLLPSDAAQLAEYYRRNEEFHREWSPPLPTGFMTKEFQEQRLYAYQLEQYVRGEQYRFGIFIDEDSPLLIGTITLSAVERKPFQNGRLGYSMDKHYTNRGILSENLKKVMQFAFEELGLHRLEANIMPRNAASQRVLQKCGFQKIGYSPKYLNIQGVWEDHELYMVLAAGVE